MEKKKIEMDNMLKEQLAIQKYLLENLNGSLTAVAKITIEKAILNISYKKYLDEKRQLQDNFKAKVDYAEELKNEIAYWKACKDENLPKKMLNEVSNQLRENYKVQSEKLSKTINKLASSKKSPSQEKEETIDTILMLNEENESVQKMTKELEELNNLKAELKEKKIVMGPKMKYYEHTKKVHSEKKAIIQELTEKKDVLLKKKEELKKQLSCTNTRRSNNISS